jgi:serine/threonine-protein kinase
MIGTLLDGRFRLERKLGSGGMSTVYRAFDETLERWVAIKVMHRDITSDAAQIERFRREARAVARLSHPHVVSVIDAGDDEGHPYIVLEYVEGETLKARIRRDGPMPVGEAVAYAIEIGAALSAAHGARLVHRDVKPQNVLIDHEGRAKLTDFGISRSLEADGLTQAGKVVGTTDYVSPEQALGQDVDGQSDIYSLGICLYEMLTGQPPFTGDSHVAVAMKHVQEPVPDVRERRPEVSAALALVVERSVAKEQQNRYATIQDLIHDLEEALAIEASRAGEATGEATTVLRQLPGSARKLAPRRLLSPNRVVLACVIVLALGALAYAAVLLIPGGTRLVPLPGIPDDLTKVRLGLDSITAFDPPPGDGEELGDSTGNVVDGNASTYWNTEGYDTEFGPAGLKEGVGLVIDAGAPVAARQLDFVTRTPGIDVQVYAAREPVFSSVADWGLAIGSVTDADEDAKVDLDTAGQEFQYYLLWITKVVPDDDGRNRASISELTLRK